MSISCSNSVSRFKSHLYRHTNIIIQQVNILLQMMVTLCPKNKRHTKDY